MDPHTKIMKILIVEDYEIIATAFKELLNKEDNISVLGPLGSREEALQLLRKRDDIDLVLMDLFLDRDEDHEEPEGLKACDEIINSINRTRATAVKLILLTAHLQGKWIKRAFDMGVHGYITKDQGVDTLLKAIKHIMDGGNFRRFFEGIVEKSMLEYLEEKERIVTEEIKLTPRELQILDMLSKGFTIKDIAAHLGIVEGTVNIHKRNIFEKLGASNAPEAVAIAFANEILPIK